MFVNGSELNEQVSLHLAERFQRRKLKCEKLTDDGCQVMAKAHIAFGKASLKGKKDNIQNIHIKLKIE